MAGDNNATRRAGNFGEEQRDGQKTAGNCAVLREAGPTPSVANMPDKVHELARRADRWRAEFAGAWEAFEDHAAWCVERRHAFSGNDLDAIVSTYREHFLSVSTGEPATLDRTLLPCFVRLLVREHPELRDLTAFRRSMFDPLFPDVLGFDAATGEEVAR